MKVAVVILNWNGQKLLKQFLPSVIKHSQDAELFVADNASTDNSVEFVKKTFPTVSIIQNSENGGFSKGYNDALNQVDADIYCLLNSDVEVTENWLNPILAEFQKNDSVAIIQPKILDFNKKDHFEYAGAGGGFIDKYGYPYCRGRLFNSIEKDSGQYDEVTEIFWASGACLFIRKSVYEELNGLDESFFAHYEEIDLCWRAHNLGYKVKYVGASTVYHVGGATLSNTNPKKTYLNFRNSLFALTKNSHGILLSKILTRLLLDGVAALKFLFEFKFKHIFAILRAHFNYYYNLSRVLEQRDVPSKMKNYYHKKSIVWSYFVRNKRDFNSL